MRINFLEDEESEAEVIAKEDQNTEARRRHRQELRRKRQKPSPEGSEGSEASAERKTWYITVEEAIEMMRI